MFGGSDDLFGDNDDLFATPPVDKTETPVGLFQVL